MPPLPMKLQICDNNRKKTNIKIRNINEDLVCRIYSYLYVIAVYEIATDFLITICGKKLINSPPHCLERVNVGNSWKSLLMINYDITEWEKDWLGTGMCNSRSLLLYTFPCQIGPSLAK